MRYKVVYQTWLADNRNSFCIMYKIVLYPGNVSSKTHLSLSNFSDGSILGFLLRMADPPIFSLNKSFSSFSTKSYIWILANSVWACSTMTSCGDHTQAGDSSACSLTMMRQIWYRYCSLILSMVWTGNSQSVTYWASQELTIVCKGFCCQDYQKDRRAAVLCLVRSSWR